MEPLLKNYFLKFCRCIPVQKVNHRIIYLFLIALVGLISVFGIHNLLFERAIATEPAATQLICSRTPNLSPEQLTTQGRQSYENGRFDQAIDCWQKAVADYRKQGNETETINNQINQAQAEQALGLFPRACNTLVQIYGERDCATLLQQEEKRNRFHDTLRERVNSPAKIAGLHSLGNILRGLGELNLSHTVLLVSLDMAQPQDKGAIWLDLGNTRRALSNKEQDFYNRSQEQENLVCAIINAYVTQDAYQKALGDSSVNLQAQLNQLSFLLDFQDWYTKINQQTKEKDDVLAQIFRKNNLFLLNKEKYCWKQLQLNQSDDLLVNKIPSWLEQQLSKQNPLIQVQQINHLQQQIEQLPLNHTSIYIQLNFAKNLMRLKDLPTIDQKIEPFLKNTIKKIQEAKAKGYQDLRAESYILGYLGKFYEDRKEWKLAEKTTLEALYIAQSIPAPEITYQWQWQLGRIYKPEPTKSQQVKAKDIQDEWKNLDKARKAYDGAFETLESLRRELATGNPDVQSSFLEEVETVYRDYVGLLLWEDSAPNLKNLSKAREAIASLQAVELENFLRQACPEYSLEDIDKIIDEKAKTAAFIYPIVLEDRIEIILKLAKEKGLQRFSQPIPLNKVENLVTQLQLDLEEEYTFDAVREKAHQMYQWLVEDVDQYIEKYNNSSQNKIDTLVFALDTNLRNIPLAALVYDQKSGSPKYLIDKYAIALAPRLEIRTPEVLQDRKLKILAAGLSEPEEKLKQNFPKLNYVEKEIGALKDFENKNSSRVSVTTLGNQEFNKEKFQTKINSSTFQILHLATHGEFSSSPENTFILAYDQPIKVNEIGDVFRKQAENQPQPIELLILSACETAAGDQRATLGISGVAVRAGARSAIASLWTLDDEISADFTKLFYQQFLHQKQTQITKAIALQQAQIKLKSLPGREHPRYWAPYILLGNWL
jgi:CHAT domain-containing protein